MEAEKPSSENGLSEEEKNALIKELEAKVDELMDKIGYALDGESTKELNDKLVETTTRLGVLRGKKSSERGDYYGKIR